MVLDRLTLFRFLLAIEILAIAVRESVKIKGVKINKVETKLLQYADERIVLLVCSLLVTFFKIPMAVGLEN